MRTDLLAALLGTAIVCTAPAVAASPTTFTYQGHLVQDGNPAEGAHEFEIRLLDNLGVQIGLTQTTSEIVTVGAFSMELDFGNVAFDGSTRYLEISVRSVVDGGAYITLSPNQLVTSTPVAQFALSGNEGPQGPAGDQGIQGNPGSDGNDGAPGADGAQGPQGNQGVPGNTGPTGPQGNPGDSHWLLSGSDTYYNAGNVGFGTNIPFFPVHARTTAGRAIFGVTTATTGSTTGVYGQSDSVNGRGVYGHASAASGTNYGIHGRTSSLNGYAGYFTGGRSYFEGYLGVGKLSPSSQLHVNSSTDESPLRVQISGSTKLYVNANGGISLGSYSTTVPNGAVYVLGNLGIGDATPDAKLDVSGNAIISTNLTVGQSAPTTTFKLNVNGTAGKTGGGLWSVFSDARLKQNIQPMTGSLDTLSKLNPVTFEYKDPNHFSYVEGVIPGFIAQDVQAIIPQWVEQADDGYLYLNPIGYESMVINALQELRKEKDAEMKKIQIRTDRLQAENDMLKARLDRLERLMALSLDR